MSVRFITRRRCFSKGWRVALGARVLVPDAHASLRVRPCCDVMLAHLKVWQHLSVDHPQFGRYATAVHIA